MDERSPDALPPEVSTGTAGTAVSAGTAGAGYQPPPAWGPAPDQPTGYHQQSPGQNQPTGWAAAPPPGWYPSAPGYSPYRPPPLDGFSVAGLIFGILPTAPLGLIFGITGIVRTAHRVRRGRALAVLGVLLSALWLVVAAAGLAARHGSSQPSAAAQQGSAVAPVPSPASTGSVWPRDLRQGDCFMVKLGDSVTAIPLLPCSKPHNAQVFANIRLTNPAYLGMAKTLDAALKLCEPAALTYMNNRTDKLHVATYYPSSAVWALGNHTAHCILYDPRQNFVGDVRDHY